ncbi:MAG: GNAT family N-acetyltransferase [Candidatus Bipolaricaulis sp.]|nr:GNAT family N-acetyltransferase [Candidatus Bipolaricaulis sp.]
MNLRALRLPGDLVPAADMLVRTFQYPDHPEWGVQSDEQEQMVGTIRRIRGVWPVIRLVQAISPDLRDVIRGYVAEENGAVIGITIAQREPKTSMWYIGTVGVLPEFRGRGVARELLGKTLAMMRERGGTSARLGVIDGNTPAQSLYQSMGFVAYGGATRFAFVPDGSCDRPSLPAGYEELPLKEFDWRPRYELDRRIVPAHLQEFEPIVPERYKTSLPLRVFAVLFRFAGNTRDTDRLVRRAADGVIVARLGWSIAKRGKGLNMLRIRLDPAQPELAPYVIRQALYEVVAKSPRLRVEVFVPNWMPAVAREAEALGFVRRTANNAMGLKL